MNFYFSQITSQQNPVWRSSDGTNGSCRLDNCKDKNIPFPRVTTGEQKEGGRKCDIRGNHQIRATLGAGTCRNY